MWHIYAVHFRLRSPLHVGHSKVGYLQRTHRYVPSRTMRGAITARLAGALGFGDYRTVGHFVRDHIVCGYFYLARGDSTKLLPRYESRELVYAADVGKPLSEREFDRTFLTSATSTALEDDGRTARDASLHEVECLSPLTNDGEPVSLWGFLYVADTVPGAPFRLELEDDDVLLSGPRTISLFRDVLNGVQVGGERRYGFGRLGFISGVQEKNESEFDGSGNWPAWDLSAKSPFIAHAVAGPTFHALGVIEPLVGRFTFDAARFGSNLTPAKICWVPGSVPQQPGTFEIRGDGILYHRK